MAAVGSDFLENSGARTHNYGTLSPPHKSEDVVAKKVELLQKWIDMIGVGQYHRMIFAFCGAGYLIDLVWAQSLSLVVPSMAQEFGLRDIEIGSLFSALSVGLTAGALTWGYLMDHIGRSACFALTCILPGICGIMFSQISGITAALVLAAIIGFGVGGNVPVDTTICFEFLPTEQRFWLTALSYFQPAGVVFACIGSAILIPWHSCDAALPACYAASSKQLCCERKDNIGWRVLMLLNGILSCTIFLARYFLVHLYETPTFLVKIGRDDLAVDVIRRIALQNGVSGAEGLSPEDLRAYDTTTTNEIPDEISPETSESEVRPKNSSSKPGSIYNRKRPGPRTTILLFALYFSSFWSFSIAGSFLPTILRDRGINLDTSPTASYWGYVYIYIWGVPGVWIATCLSGRKRAAICCSAAIQGFSLLLVTRVRSYLGYISIAAVAYLCQSMFSASLTAWTPELFSPNFRGTAYGAASFCGRLATIISPLVASQFVRTSPETVLALSAVGALVSGYFAALIRE